MDIEADFLVNPFSYVLGAVSFVGFFIVARNEISLWFHQLFAKRRVLEVVNSTRPSRPATVILGLILMGIVFSTLIFIFNEKAEHLEAKMTLDHFMLIMFAFTMLPGGLAGMAAGAWINAISRNHAHYLPEWLLTGMLVYLALIIVVEFSNIHPLLFFCGPAVTLLVYRFSPI